MWNLPPSDQYVLLLAMLSADRCVFSGMLEDGEDGIHISDAFHKAFLEVGQLPAALWSKC